MTLAEVSEYLRIPVSTIYKLSRKGALPAQKLGKQWRYHKDAIDEWLRGNINRDVQQNSMRDNNE